MKKLLLLLLALTSTSVSAGLVIHASEFGVGKFHRYDNQVHAYGTSAWSPFILADNAPTRQPLIQTNADGSITVFFSTLEELLSSVIRVSMDRRMPVSVLNVHGHGLPGLMWFPKDSRTMQAWECADWRDAAAGSDAANYNQYYSAIPADEIRAIRSMADRPSLKPGCTVGLEDWRAGVTRFPQFKTVLAGDVQVHFLSCVVGLGKAGQAFTQGMAELLLPTPGTGRIETATAFGLGDWSMPEGMGFWDLQSDEQVERDNALYVANKTDREIAQVATIRMASRVRGSSLEMSLVPNVSYMRLGFESAPPHSIPVLDFDLRREDAPTTELPPKRVRIPGTGSYVSLR